MANPHLGEVDLKAGDKVYRLRFTTNGQAEMEERLGISTAELLGKFQSGAMGFREIRGLLWSALRKHHSDLTLEDAGNVMDEARMDELMTAMSTLFERAFPELAGAGGKETEEGSGEGKAAGTGGASS